MYDELITQAEWDTMELRAEWQAAVDRCVHEMHALEAKYEASRSLAQPGRHEVLAALADEWTMWNDELSIAVMGLTAVEREIAAWR